MTMRPSSSACAMPSRTGRARSEGWPWAGDLSRSSPKSRMPSVPCHETSPCWSMSAASVNVSALSGSTYPRWPTRHSTCYVDGTHRGQVTIDRKERTVLGADFDVLATLALGALVLLVYARRALRFLDEIL
jgi:hypothetical protein